jgi:hypothetical protein
MSADNDPVVIESPLSQRISMHGVTVQIEIYEDGNGKWILEVVDQQKTSHVWDDPFETDELALAEAVRALEEEPLEGSPQPPDGAH